MADDNNGLGYITELRQTDVLFGRGSGPNDHEGNIRFRQLVAERKDEYLATNHRQTKAKIAREIVNTVLHEGGRFLKKVEPSDAQNLNIPKGLDAWIMVDDDTVMEKAKQALRQNTNKGRANSPNRGTTSSSPLRGNSPVRGNVSPVRSQVSPVRSQVSPVPSGHVSPVPAGVSPHYAPPHQSRVSPVPPAQQQRHPMPSFEDLEPLPLTMNNNSGNNAVRNSNQHHQHQHQQPYGGMTLLQQQQQQLQQQVAAQQRQQLLQQRQQQQLLQQQQGLGVEPTPLGWGGGSDHNNSNNNQYSTHTVSFSNMRGGGGGDWGNDNSNRYVLPNQQPDPTSDTLETAPLWGGGSAHGRMQQSNNDNMAPPQRRMPSNSSMTNNNNNHHHRQADVNNWGVSSEHTVQTGHSGGGGPMKADEEPLTLEELRKRRQSLHVEDLMDSFSNMKAGDFSSDAKNQESSDTMGTIEPIGGAYDSTNMSVTSFSSSTFSMFKDAMGQSTDSMPLSRGVSRNNSSIEPRPDSLRTGTGASQDMMSMQSLNSLNSIGNLSDVWGSRRASLLDRLVQEERERAASQGSSSGDGLAEAPRPVGLMEEEPGSLPSLGASSLSVMKAAFDSSRTSTGNNSGTGQNLYDNKKESR